MFESLLCFIAEWKVALLIGREFTVTLLVKCWLSSFDDLEIDRGKTQVLCYVLIRVIAYAKCNASG